MSEGKDDVTEDELNDEQRQAVANLLGIEPDEVTSENVESLMQEAIADVAGGDADEGGSLGDVVPRDEEGNVDEDDPNHPEVTIRVPFHSKNDGTRLVADVTYRVPSNAINLVERLVQSPNKQQGMFDLFEDIIVSPEELVEQDVFDWYFEHRKFVLNRIFESFSYSAGVDSDFFRTRLGFTVSGSTNRGGEPSTQSPSSTDNGQASSEMSGAQRSESKRSGTPAGSEESVENATTTT